MVCYVMHQSVSLSFVCTVQRTLFKNKIMPYEHLSIIILCLLWFVPLLASTFHLPGYFCASSHIMLTFLLLFGTAVWDSCSECLPTTTKCSWQNCKVHVTGLSLTWEVKLLHLGFVNPHSQSVAFSGAYLFFPIWNFLRRLGISYGWVYVLPPLELCGEVRD